MVRYIPNRDSSVRRATRLCSPMCRRRSLAAETVKGTALSFQRIHDVHRSDGLPFGMFGVRYGVAYDVLEEYLEDASRFFVYQAGYSLHAAASRQSSDGRLGDALDIVTQHLTMTLRAALSQTFATFTTACHFCCR